MKHEDIIKATAKEHGNADTSYYAEIKLPMYAIIELMAKARQEGFEDGMAVMNEANFPNP